VNRANLKFTNFKHNYKPQLALELNSSPKERAKINHKQIRRMTRGFIYRGSVLANLLPIEVVTKTGSLSTLTLSQTVT
jgi:hypothetical protein